LNNDAGRFRKKAETLKDRIKMILKKYPFVVWAVLIWAMVMGCFVTDFLACPWTAVFP